MSALPFCASRSEFEMDCPSFSMHPYTPKEIMALLTSGREGKLELECNANRLGDREQEVVLEYYTAERHRVPFDPVEPADIKVTFEGRHYVGSNSTFDCFVDSKGKYMRIRFDSARGRRFGQRLKQAKIKLTFPPDIAYQP